MTTTLHNPGNRYRNPVECDHCPNHATVMLGRKRQRYLCERHANPEPVAHCECLCNLCMDGIHCGGCQ